MLTITTLLLGLIGGPQTVDLAAGSEVARIELAVGRTPCATLLTPPWRAECDFGAAPAPARLTATGYSVDGRELARAERIVNRYRAAAEVALHLEHPPAGGLVARIAAGSLVDGPPRSTRVELDGVELPAPDPARVELPALEFEVPHLLRAELEWSDTVSAVGELIFGGRHGETISTELTAVAVEARGELPFAAAESAFATASGPVRAVALDEGPAELYVVVDPEAVEPLRRAAAITTRVPLASGSSPQPSLGPQTLRLSGVNQRFLYTLERNDRIRLLWPWPERRESGGRQVAEFPPSPIFTAADGGLVWIVARAHLPRERKGPPALADAAAVAGMIAESRARRRAVLVLLGANDPDASRLDPPALRSYLAALRVPLFVWRAEKRRGEGSDPWGEPVVLGSSSRLQRAFGALAESLERQRIAWVEGAHLPNEIEIAAGARRDLRFAGEAGR